MKCVVVNVFRNGMHVNRDSPDEQKQQPTRLVQVNYCSARQVQTKLQLTGKLFYGFTVVFRYKLSLLSNR